jgi:hypothetical protein
MLGPFKLQLARWAQGLIRGCVQGGALAVKAWAGAAIVAPAARVLGFHDVILSVQTGAAVFLFGVLWELVNYLATHPLPDLAEGESNQSSVTSNQSPESK